VPEPGQILRAVRERLQLRYRDVEQASQTIANLRGSDEYLIRLSRLADIENKGTVPSLYRCYSLCAIYGLELETVLEWYGIPLGHLALDSARLKFNATRIFNLKSPHLTQNLEVPIPELPSNDFDFTKTVIISRKILQWGKLSAHLLQCLDLRNYRYGFVGTEDWSMYPLLAPGSFIQIDDSKKAILKDGWVHEYERPIYFLEHRDGFRCGWCIELDNLLTLQPHPSSTVIPQVFRLPEEAEVIGQVVGVAMRLDLVKPRRKRF
jgi:hypothetical protein